MSTVIAFLLNVILVFLFIRLLTSASRRSDKYRNQPDYDDSDYTCPTVAHDSYVKTEDADGILSIQEKRPNE